MTQPAAGMMFEDYALGARYRSRGRTITETDLVTFVNLAWFTEELFTNIAEREDLLLPGRVVPGALVYAFAEGLMMPVLSGNGLAFLGTDLKIPAPTFVGDTIYVEWEVTSVRRSSKPGRGVVQTLNRVVNHTGEVVLIYTPARLVRSAA